MTLDEGRKLIELVLHKDMNGGKLKPADYNIILSELYIPFTKSVLENITAQKQNSTESTYGSIKSLRELLTSVDLTIVLGVGDMTSLTNYLYMDSMYATYGTALREVKYVDGEMFVKRISDMLSEDPEHYPFATIRNTSLIVRPADLSPITVNYYRKPVKPVYDYYIDVNGRIQYLSQSSTHVWVTGEKDSTGTTHTTGDANWASLTKELEFNEDLHLDFFNEVLMRMGIKVEKMDVIQYAKTLKAEQEAI